LFKKIANKSINTIFSDYYKAYESLVQNSQHIQSKAETYTIEGYNPELAMNLVTSNKIIKFDIKKKASIVINFKVNTIKHFN